MSLTNNTDLNCSRNRSLNRAQPLLLLGASIIALMAAPHASALEVNALPAGGTVIAGDAHIDYSTTNELHIHQSSDRAVINWESFNIGAEALTQFHQNNSNALAVNRITGDGLDPTQILGALKANGRLLVLDQNGVIFGKNATVDAGSIIVSTGDINIDSIMDDGAIQLQNIGPEGLIVNNGSINAAEAGLIALVAPGAINNGVINATLGRIQIGAGDKATIDLYGDGLMELELDKGTQQTLINNGIIMADGGRVQIEAAAAKDVVDNLIMNTGIIAARSVEQHNGKIILRAGGSNKSTAEGGSTSYNDGYITTAGIQENETGGTIEMLADKVVLDEHTLIDASGANGGGDIKIGGDYLGTGDTPTARNTYVAPNALIFNDAIIDGDGGRTIIWSDDTTEFYGSIYGRGGTESGDGGFVETSGKNNLLAQGYVDLTSANGDKGTYLLDPADITIYGNFDPTDIAGLEVWLDASDTNTITEAATNVSQWADKSGNNNNATQANVAKSPTHGSDATGEFLEFTGPGNSSNANNYLDFDAPIDGQSVFFIGDVDASANGYNGVVTSTQGTSNEDYIFIVSTGAAYGVSLDGSSNAQGSWYLNDVIMGTGTDVGLANDVPLGAAIHNFVYPNASAPPNNYTSIGNLDNVRNQSRRLYGYDGKFRELTIYSTPITGTDQTLINQYHSAKWDIELTPPGTGASESARAMASDGYGAFTSGYLEHLSNTADIVLQASNSITLDLQGDNLSLSNGRDISLITGTGDINVTSIGTITTGGGDVNFTTGGTGDINVSFGLTLNAIGGGDLTFTTGGVTKNIGNVTVIEGTRLGDLYIPPENKSPPLPPSVIAAISNPSDSITAPSTTSSKKTENLRAQDSTQDSADIGSGAVDCLVSMDEVGCVIH